MRIVLGLLLWLASPAHAGYPLLVESIEWGVADADVVVRGAVTRAVALDDNAMRCTVIVHETIKGSTPRALSIVIDRTDVTYASDVVFFLRRAGGELGLRPRASAFGRLLRAIDLRDPPKLMRRDFAIVETRARILAALRRAPKRDIAAHVDSPVVGDVRAKTMGSATGIVLRVSDF